MAPAMLPVTFRFLIGMIAYAINKRLAGRIDYYDEGTRGLREAVAVVTGKTRIAFPPDQRLRLALRGKPLTPKEPETCCHIV